MSENILDLSDLAPKRQLVRFTEDGPLFAMATPTDMSIRDRSKLWAIHSQIEELGNATGRRKRKGREDTTEQDAERITRLYTDAAKIILFEMDDSEVEALSDFHKEAVVLGFMAAYGRAMEKVAKKTGGRGLAQAMTAAATSAS